VITAHDAATLELAILMRCDPRDIDTMAYLDSISWLQRYHRHDQADRTFTAALHGVKLK
jgi:hypothetical protein